MMTEKDNALIFMPSPEEKEIAVNCTNQVINIIEKYTKGNIGLKCFIMQMLLEGFEESFNVDIRNGISHKHNNEDMVLYWTTWNESNEDLAIISKFLQDHDADDKVIDAFMEIVGEVGE